MSFLCPYCDREPVLVTGREVYPHRPDLWEKKSWVCRPCGARVGCHPGTDAPLGTLANGALRDLRRRVHALFDPRWIRSRKKHKARVEAYTWLAERLGIPLDDCHVGQFDEEMCGRAIELLRRTAE